jgi:hypothetical protein
MTHNCRMGWLPNAQMIADGMPDAPKAKPPALLRRPATEFKGECFDARDMAHPAAKAVSAPARPRTHIINVNTGHRIGPGTIAAAVRQVVRSQTEGNQLSTTFDSLYLEAERAAREVPQFATLQDCLEWARKKFDTSGMSVQDVMRRVTAMRRASLRLPAAGTEVSATPAQADPEWIEWKGGECPVPLDATIEYRLRSGYSATRKCGEFLSSLWVNHESSWDIVAYRVLP